jgi:hypothetical protein
MQFSQALFLALSQARSPLASARVIAKNQSCWMTRWMERCLIKLVRGLPRGRAFSAASPTAARGIAACGFLRRDDLACPRHPCSAGRIAPSRRFVYFPLPYSIRPNLGPMSRNSAEQSLFAITAAPVKWQQTSELPVSMKKVTSSPPFTRTLTTGSGSVWKSSRR